MAHPNTVDAIVLVGPPGAGKSHLGRYLARCGVARYIELEPVLVKRFGRGDQFAQNKAAALAFLREIYRDELRESDDRALVIESTGLSDRPILEELARAHRLVYVRIDTPRDVCIRRVSRRQAGRNIRNDVEATGAFYDFWEREIAPSLSFDLTVTGENAEEAARQIGNLLTRLS